MALAIPSLILQRLYTFGSLENCEGGVRFSIKNRLSDVVITDIRRIGIAGEDVPLKKLIIEAEDEVKASEVSEANALSFPLSEVLGIRAEMPELSFGKHLIEIEVVADPFGTLAFEVEDVVSAESLPHNQIPRTTTDDYSETAIITRQNFITERTGVNLNHISHYNFDPHILNGNCENFTGVAQIPIGFAGPLTVNGEHAQGGFYIPLATTEGTLVASYNRGIKLLNQSGGVKTTLIGDAMQRAPVFVFEDARGGRDFVHWINANMSQIREAAEATSSIVKLTEIDSYLSNKFAYLRFNYTTGDAAGQNMVGRATSAACSWIRDAYAGANAPIQRFFLESNLATDKKASHINTMRTRGKRVVAEVVVPRDALIQTMRVTPEALVYHSHVANVGAFLSGVNNNGLHSVNGITAMFIATGQDVANVAESSTGILYSEVTPENDLYISMTIPSLIVATYGGGTGLATQKECLAILDCVGQGKVRKFAEIVAGVVLAGELSLASAISSSDWVSSHEEYGRNR